MLFAGSDHFAFFFCQIVNKVEGILMLKIKVIIFKKFAGKQKTSLRGSIHGNSSHVLGFYGLIERSVAPAFFVFV